MALPFGQPGKLHYDEIMDALLCHLCGGWYRNLAQHARLAHGLTAGEYCDLAGLSRQTRLVSPTRVIDPCLECLPGMPEY